LFATLNGVKLPIGLAKKMKFAGNKKGVPDLWLPVRRGRHSGLVIELKKEVGGKVTPEQKVWLAKLKGEGFCACVCNGFTETINKLESYLKLRKVKK
jgi:hypothetical protein